MYTVDGLFAHTGSVVWSNDCLRGIGYEYEPGLIYERQTGAAICVLLCCGIMKSLGEFRLSCGFAISEGKTYLNRKNQHEAPNP